MEVSNCHICGRQLDYHIVSKKNCIPLHLFLDQNSTSPLLGRTYCKTHGKIKDVKLSLHVLSNTDLVQLVAFFLSENGMSPTKSLVLKKVQHAFYLYCKQWGLPFHIFNALKSGLKMNKYGAICTTIFKSMADLCKQNENKKLVTFKSATIERLLTTLVQEELTCIRDAVFSTRDPEEISIELWRELSERLKMPGRQIYREFCDRLIEEREWDFVQLDAELNPIEVIKVKPSYRKPMASVLRDIQTLKSCKRYGTRTTFGHIDTVAAHTYAVENLSTLIGCYLNDNGEKVDIDKTSRIAHYHDLAESRMGDIPGHVKDKHDEDKETRYYNNISQDLPSTLKEIMIEARKEYVDQQSIEAKIAKLADKLDAMHQILLNKHAAEFFEVGINYLNDIERLSKKDLQIKQSAEFVLLCLEHIHPHIRELFQKKSEQDRFRGSNGNS